MMLNYFAALVRVLVIVAFVFFVAALTASQLHPMDGESGRRIASSWDSSSDESDQDDARLRLIDRNNGRTATVAAPAGERWHYLSPSPWRDEDGAVEAVGRFTRRFAAGADAGAAVCGLVRLSLPGAQVIERVGLDVLPTGRPAWNPIGNGQVLLAAGDGRLYSYRFAARRAAEGLITTPETEAAVGSGLTAVEWRCRPPGEGEPLLTDPIWPTLPESPNLVIVSMSLLRTNAEGRRAYEPTVLWWLRLNSDGEEILEAGPLIEPSDDPDAGEAVRHRLPRVARRNDRIQVAYLASRLDGAESEPRVGDLERRPGDGRLRLRFD